MAGGNLELFKFGFYVLFPIWSMYHFASPEWWEANVKHLKFWPDESRTNRLPVEREDIKQALADLRAQRLERKSLRDQLHADSREQGQEQASAQSPNAR